MTSEPEDVLMQREGEAIQYGVVHIDDFFETEL